MKYSIFAIALLSLTLLISCDKDDDMKNDDTKTELSGNWELVQMNGSLPNSETTGSEMDWQESYLLNADGTFEKTRDRDGVVTKISGTFNLINNSDESFLELSYDNDSEIIGSCYSILNKEEMLLQSDNTFSSTWQNCDGPGLKYEKID